MKKTHTRILALLLSMVMTLSLLTPALLVIPTHPLPRTVRAAPPIRLTIPC